MNRLRINGSFMTQPIVGSPSMEASIMAPLDETVDLVQMDGSRIVRLLADGAVSVPLPTGMTAVHVFYAKVVSGGSGATAVLTSAAGSAQAVPVDPIAILHSMTNPFTAIALTRPAGVDTTVEVFLGQKL